MKLQWKKLILCLLIPLTIGGLSALFSRNTENLFDTLQKPPLSPPGWIFPIVWIFLYLLMGLASYLVFVSNTDKQIALQFYGIQLIFNFFWPIIFFRLEQFLAAFFCLLLLWLFLAATIVLFYNSSKLAGILMLPYFLWVTFAGYLNLSIYFLNSSH